MFHVHMLAFLTSTLSDGFLHSNLGHFIKDLSSVKAGFKSVPLQLYFEIAGLASAKNWRKIQNIDEEEHFLSRLLPCKDLYIALNCIFQ